jgi:hypothetical protein
LLSAERAESKNQQPFGPYFAVVPRILTVRGVSLCSKAEIISFAVISRAKENDYFLLSVYVRVGLWLIKALEI